MKRISGVLGLIVFIAVGLAMDAFAVSVVNGITVRDLRAVGALRIALCFGLFQFGMTLLGWLLGGAVSTRLEAYDHWIAFALLVFIGAKMLHEAAGRKGDEEPALHELTLGGLLMQGVATSIDALAVGVTLALISSDILFSCAVVGVVAFGFSLVGALIGKKIGPLFRKGAEWVGGLVLIGIGVKILVEHLYF